MVRNIIGLLLVCWVALSFNYANSETLMTIEGTVKNIKTGEPVFKASISNDQGFSTVTTDREGRFKTVIPASKPISLTIHKEGYEKSVKMLDPISKVNIHIALQSLQRDPQIIYKEEFRKNVYIRGKITGLKESDYKNYKILIYVLTDKWYIHPYAVNEEGRGYASIQQDGSWEIGTIYRGYQAYKVAIILVKKSSYAPSTVAIFRGDPEQELLARINTETSLFIEAPTGI